MRGEPNVWGKRLRLEVCEEAAGPPPVPGRPAAESGWALTLLRGLWQRPESQSLAIQTCIASWFGFLYVIPRPRLFWCSSLSEKATLERSWRPLCFSCSSAYRALSVDMTEMHQNPRDTKCMGPLSAFWLARRAC